ncbi:MAG: hypothetical protein V3S68_02685 [Dehalococcoidia bacterium]
MPVHPEAPSTFTFVITTDQPDGNGNQTALHGWDLDRFNANPVVFFNHMTHLPPVGRSSDLQIRGSQMFATIEFAPSELGAELARLVADDFIIGASVGWKPLEWEFTRNPQHHITGVRSTRQELTEISIVGLPAHAETLKAALLAAANPETINLAALQSQADIIIGTVPRPELVHYFAHFDKYHETGVAASDTPSAMVSTLAGFNKDLRGSP